MHHVRSLRAAQNRTEKWNNRFFVSVYTRICLWPIAQSHSAICAWVCFQCCSTCPTFVNNAMTAVVQLQKSHGSCQNGKTAESAMWTAGTNCRAHDLTELQALCAVIHMV